MRYFVRVGFVLILGLVSCSVGFAAETLSGTITDATTSAGLSGIDLDVLNAAGASVAITGGTSGVGGAFTLTLPGPGTYTVRADASRASGYADEFYSEVFFPSQAQAVTVNTGQAITGINFTLSTGFEIQGTLRDSVTNLPLAGIDLDVFASNGDFLGGYPGASGVDGTFALGAFPPGNYFVRADADPSIGQYYVDTYYGGGTSLGTATAITVGAANVTGADILLVPGGTISGTVSDIATTLGVSGIDLDVFDATGVELTQSATTDALGGYTLGAIPAGTYTLRVDPTIAQGYPRTYHPNSYTSTLAIPITVTAGADTSGIDFSLTRAGSITGTIKDAGTLAVLAGIDLDCYDAAGNRITVNAVSGPAGTYQIGPLAVGTYTLRADPTPVQGYARQYFDGKVSRNSADLITVTALTATPNVNFALVGAGNVSGRITDAGSGLPISGMDIDILTAVTFIPLEQNATTDSNGNFQLTGIPAGNYVVRADPTPAQLYPRTYRGGAATPELATVVVVSAGQTTSAVDIPLALPPCALEGGTCPDFSAEGAALVSALVGLNLLPPATDFATMDLDALGLPDAYEVALAAHVLCGGGLTFGNSVVCVYNDNLATLRAQAAYPLVSAQEHVVALLLSISPELQGAVAGLGLTGTYSVMAGGALAAGSDPDSDGSSNLVEFGNVNARAGTQEEYVAAALNPLLDGSESADALPAAGVGAIVALMFVLAFAGAVRSAQAPGK